MKKAKPTVSVCLPVYNGEGKIEPLLESLWNQTFQDFELVVADNASTDGTEKYLRDLAETEPRIRYHRFVHNAGCSHNYNRAFELSCGQFTLWAACDDRFEPEYIASCLEALQQHPDAVLCYSAVKIICGDESVKGIGQDPFAIDSDQAAERLLNLIAHLGACNCLFGLMRREALESTQLMRTDFPAPDNLLLAELALRGKFIQLPQPLFRRGVGDREAQVNFYQHEHNQERLFANTIARRGCAMPFSMMGKRHLDALLEVDLPPQLQNAAVQQTRQIWQQRWSQPLKLEIQRAVQSVLQGRFPRHWDLEPEQNPPLTAVSALEMLSQIDDALQVWPDYPGLHLARSICLKVRNLPIEARHEAMIELEYHPELTQARQWLAQLRRDAATTAASR